MKKAAKITVFVFFVLPMLMVLATVALLLATTTVLTAI